MSAQATQRHTKQVETVPIALIDILRHDCFKEGFIDGARSRTPISDFGGDRQAAWLYEHGRKVAIEARNTHGRVPQLWYETDAGLAINPQIISLAGAMFLTGAFA